MRYRYNSELKFLIPHFVELNGVVIGCDYYLFKRKLMDSFKAIDLNYYQILPIKEVIDGLEYDAEQVVVYCDDSFEQVIIQTFWEVCCEYHKELGIDTFYYIQSGVLICLTIGGENDEILRDS